MSENTEDLLNRLQKTINIVHNPMAGWTILVVSLILTFAAYWIASKQIAIRAEERFQFRTEEITKAIHDRMSLYELALHGAAGFFSASTNVSRAEWRTYVASLQLAEKLPGIQGLGYAAVVADKVKHFEHIRSQGFPDFTLRPEGERDTYTSIIYLEPFDWRNQRAFGYDMWSNELRRIAMSRARDSGDLATSAMITLVQETDKDIQHGFLTYMPIYRNKVTPLSVTDRQEQLQGWVYAAFRAGDLMNGILGAQDSAIAFEIYDGSVRQAESLLFDSDGELSLLKKENTSVLTMTKQLMLQGQEWTVFFNATEAMLANREEAELPRYVLIAGIVVDLLLFYVILSLHFVNKHIRQTSKKLKQEYEVNQQGLIMQTQLVEATEKEAETFFEMAPDAFLVISGSGEVVRANQYAHELFGYDLGELLGCKVDDLVPVDIRPGHAALRNHYFENPEPRMMGGSSSLTAVKKSGDLLSVTVNLKPLEFKGETHVVVVLHDISGQKKLEQTMALAKEKAESASRSKSDFVANMSHEIRTPLNAVIGAAQLLVKTSPTTVQTKYINMIRSSGEALLGVINDILDFSKIEAGFMELAPTPFDLSEVLARVGVMMSISAGEKEIELVIKMDSDVCTHVIGDSLRLQQVLINLASNAIKFTDQGSVELHVQLLELKEGVQKLKFSIADTGIGMNSEQRDKLFKAFSQADESITRRFGGTGLGLVISNRIVEMMGAQIQVETEQNVGTTFSFSIELVIEGGVLPQAEHFKEAGLKVLLIDDHPATRKAIAEMVLCWGLGCWVYSSWEEAEKSLEGKPLLAEFDIVILDWRLTSGDGGAVVYGNDVLANLRRMGLKSSCASILSSGNNQCAALLMDGMQKEFDASLVKPVLKKALLIAFHEAGVRRTGKGFIAFNGMAGDQIVGKVAGVRILLVEDNIFNQTIAVGLLEDMGAKVTVANNGEEAVEAYKRDPKRFDVILMDIQMPVMDGLTATQHLRTELHCELPIIAMTAGVLKSERDKYLKGGMNSFVAKPIDESELYGAIHSSLSSAVGVNIDANSVKAVTKPPIETALVFNSKRLELLSKGKSNRVKSIIDSLDSLAFNGEQSLLAAWDHVEIGDWDQARFLFHGVKGQVANYGGESLALCIQSLEQGLRDSLALEDLQGLFRLAIESYHDYIQLALEWKEEQKKLFDEE